MAVLGENDSPGGRLNRRGPQDEGHPEAARAHVQVVGHALVLQGQRDPRCERWHPQFEPPLSLPTCPDAAAAHGRGGIPLAGGLCTIGVK
jgi:hypothetical protein